jgi:hypothetical protein
MFLGVNLDAGGTEREETLLIFTKVKDKLFGVESTVSWLVDRLRHLLLIEKLFNKL